MSENNLKEICWRQRFSNYKNALALLQEGVRMVMPSKIEEKGIIKAYEFTFELGWKAIKDYLESQGIVVKFPRKGIKLAFENDFILSLVGLKNFFNNLTDENK